MRSRHLLQMFLLSAVWGVSFLMMRIAIFTFPPAWIALLRCTLGASLLWSVLWFGRHALPPRRLAPWLLLVALLNNAIPFSFFAWGERTVPSNIAAVLNATMPIWTLLFSMLVQRVAAGPRIIFGVLLSFAGVLLVVVQAGGAAPQAAGGGILGGAFIIALAAISYAAATLVAKIKLGGVNALGLATTQLSLASLMLLPVAAAGDIPSTPRPGPVAAVAVLGFAGSGIAYLLYYRLLAEISATRLAAVTYLMPIWGLFWGWLAGESVGIYAWLGVAVTIGGLLLTNSVAPDRNSVPVAVPANTGTDPR